MGDDLAAIPWSIELARRTRRVIRGNLAWAFGYNSLGVACAAVGWLNPALAAALMVASSTLVVVNSLRLGRAFEVRLDGRAMFERTAEHPVEAEATACPGGRRAMIELPMVFLGGLLGSAHCVGMCGGFALGIGLGARTSRPTSAVKSSTRPVGSSRIRSWASPRDTPGPASRAASARGSTCRRRSACSPASCSPARDCWDLASSRARFRPGPRGGPLCLAGTFVGPFLRSPRSSDVLLAGIFTGFLPCGLVYGFLALASSSASVPQGLLTMALFGAGTGPLMILAGAGGSLLSHVGRRNVLRVSAVCVLLTGLISIARGLLFVQLVQAPEVVRCVLCGSSGG